MHVREQTSPAARVSIARQARFWPVRYQLIGLTFALSMLLYVDRVAISTARGPLTSELGLSDTQFGWVLSALLGYALFQTPGGFLADRFGARVALTSVVALWSVFTALTGLARGYLTLLVYRFLFGAGEAGVSHMRQGVLQLAAGIRARSRPGHQLLGRPARRGVRASRDRLAGDHRGVAGRLLCAGRYRAALRGGLVVVVSRPARGSSVGLG